MLLGRLKNLAKQQISTNVFVNKHIIDFQRFSQQGMEPDLMKVEAIKMAEPPANFVNFQLKRKSGNGSMNIDGALMNLNYRDKGQT